MSDYSITEPKIKFMLFGDFIAVVFVFSVIFIILEHFLVKKNRNYCYVNEHIQYRTCGPCIKLFQTFKSIKLK